MLHGDVFAFLNTYRRAASVDVEVIK